MAVPVAIFLAVNAGRPSAGGWGTAMSTDTAFALGMLALVGPKNSDRLRSYLLTFAVVDDLTTIVVIARGLQPPHRRARAAGRARRARCRLPGQDRRACGHGVVYAGLGLAAWGAFFRSGVDPAVSGMVMGLLTPAYPAARSDLEQATARVRRFREQPTPEMARAASISLSESISPNGRLQDTFHPWASYVIVPLFALANAGLVISGAFLAHAFTSPVTLGILAGYVVGKPIGTAGAAWLVTAASRGRLRPPAGWAAVTGAGTIAGVGVTVSLLVASLAFHGEQLDRGQGGRAGRGARRGGAHLGGVPGDQPAAEADAAARAARHGQAAIIDLAAPVDPRRDHMRGPKAGPGHRGRVRRLRMPLLRPGRTGHPGSCWPTSGTCATSGGTCRSPTCTRTPSSRPRRRRPRPRRAAFWEMHDTLLRPPGRAAAG